MTSILQTVKLVFRLKVNNYLDIIPLHLIDTDSNNHFQKLNFNENSVIFTHFIIYVYIIHWTSSQENNNYIFGLTFFSAKETIVLS